MSSAVNRCIADRQYLRGLPAYAIPELLITGVFSYCPSMGWFVEGFLVAAQSVRLGESCVIVRASTSMSTFTVVLGDVI